MCCGRIEVRGVGVFQVKGYPSQARHGASHVDLAAARIGVYLEEPPSPRDCRGWRRKCGDLATRGAATSSKIATCSAGSTHQVPKAVDIARRRHHLGGEGQ